MKRFLLYHCEVVFLCPHTYKSFVLRHKKKVDDCKFFTKRAIFFVPTTVFIKLRNVILFVLVARVRNDSLKQLNKT